MRRPNINYANASERVCNLTKAEIDDYAAKAAIVFQLKPGGDLLPVVERLGGRTRVVDIFSREDEDTIYVHGKRDFDIVLSSLSTPRRERFTIAHELGHYFLHSFQGEVPLVAARSGSGRAEWEANWFAAGFIMPDKEFRAAHKATPDASVLAEHFGVSRIAAETRIKVLAL